MPIPGSGPGTSLQIHSEWKNQLYKARVPVVDEWTEWYLEWHVTSDGPIVAALLLDLGGHRDVLRAEVAMR